MRLANIRTVCYNILYEVSLISFVFDKCPFYLGFFGFLQIYLLFKNYYYYLKI